MWRTRECPIPGLGSFRSFTSLWLGLHRLHRKYLQQFTAAKIGFVFSHLPPLGGRVRPPLPDNDPPVTVAVLTVASSVAAI